MDENYFMYFEESIIVLKQKKIVTKCFTILKVKSSHIGGLGNPQNWDKIN
jgi:hypothetical protein